MLFMMCILSRPITLSVLIERQESESSIHTYKLAVNELLSKYNTVLQRYGTNIQTTRVVSFSQYEYMKEYGPLEMLAGSDNILQRREVISRMFPGENVIALVITGNNEVFDRYNVYGVCASVIFVNITLEEDLLSNIFNGIFKLFSILLHAPTTIDLSANEQEIINHMSRMISKGLYNRNILQEIQECQCKYKECDSDENATNKYNTNKENNVNSHNNDLDNQNKNVTGHENAQKYNDDNDKYDNSNDKSKNQKNAGNTRYNNLISQNNNDDNDKNRNQKNASNTKHSNLSSPNNNDSSNNTISNLDSNLLLISILRQLQKMTENTNRNNIVLPPNSIINKKKKRLSAFTEPYRMSDYDDLIGQKRKETKQKVGI